MTNDEPRSDAATDFALASNLASITATTATDHCTDNHGYPSHRSNLRRSGLHLRRAARNAARRAAAAPRQLLGKIAWSWACSPKSSRAGPGRADGHAGRRAGRHGHSARGARQHHRADGPAVPRSSRFTSTATRLTVATCDPQNITIQDELRTFLGYEIKVVIAGETRHQKDARTATTTPTRRPSNASSTTSRTIRI